MKVSVLGCGWMGFPLSQQLVRENIPVKGATTTPAKLKQLGQAGIDPFRIVVPESILPKNSKQDAFWESDVLFLNIPPGRRTPGVEERFPQFVKLVVDKASQHGISWIIFAGSTSVYNSKGGVMKEEDARPGNASGASGEAHLVCEQILEESTQDYTILRFGGLYGYDRHPIKYLSGKKELDEAARPVNLVHQDDCVAIVTKILLEDIRNETFNVVSDGHPPRKEFYEAEARHFNLPPPRFKPDHETHYKVVSNVRLKKRLRYVFKYPNPLDPAP